MKIPKRSVKNIVMTKDGFYSLASLLNKATSSMLTIDPLKIPSEQIRTQYDSIYQRCVVLYREDDLSKQEIKDIAETYSGLKYSIDPFNREITLQYRQTYMKQTGDVIINITHELGSFCNETLNSLTEEDGQKEKELIFYKYNYL